MKRKNIYITVIIIVLLIAVIFVLGISCNSRKEKMEGVFEINEELVEENTSSFYEEDTSSAYIEE